MDNGWDREGAIPPVRRADVTGCSEREQEDVILSVAASLKASVAN
jgi:hypothetical protein